MLDAASSNHVTSRPHLISSSRLCSLTISFLRVVHGIMLSSRSHLHFTKLPTTSYHPVTYKSPRTFSITGRPRHSELTQAISGLVAYIGDPGHLFFTFIIQTFWLPACPIQGLAEIDWGNPWARILAAKVTPNIVRTVFQLKLVHERARMGELER